MKRRILITTIVTITLLLFLVPPVLSQPNAEDLTITILYDNYQFQEDMLSGWGFSCLVEGTGETILFDIASNAVITNMEKLGIDLEIVDVVVFSHIHPDHTDGAMAFWQQNSNVTVYIPASWPESVRNVIQNSVMKCIETHDPVEVCDGVYLTEDLPSIAGGGSATVFGIFATIAQTREQALAIKTAKGLVIITGCAHPGIVEIVKRVKEITSEDNIYLLIGGFHLLDKGTQQIKEIINDLNNENVKKVSATHCTGDSAIALFKEEYGDDFIPTGVGKEIIIEAAFPISSVYPQDKLTTTWGLVKFK